jgi:hypothetical protein
MMRGGKPGPGGVRVWEAEARARGIPRPARARTAFVTAQQCRPPLVDAGCLAQRPRGGRNTAACARRGRRAPRHGSSGRSRAARRREVHAAHCGVDCNTQIRL